MAIQRNKRRTKNEDRGAVDMMQPAPSDRRRRGRNASAAEPAPKMSKKEARKAAKMEADRVRNAEAARRKEANRIAAEREETLARHQAERAKAAPENDLRRYQGYDVSEFARKQEGKPKKWFWKILIISLVMSVAIIIALLVVAMLFNKKQTDYISGINASNTLDALMDGKENLQITVRYSNTADNNDYTSTRLLRKDKNGEFFSYCKTEGGTSDYKEVMSKGQVFRNIKDFTYYYAMIGEEYQERMKEFDEELFTISPDEKMVQQSEGSGIVNIKTRYEVQAGDKYTTKFGCNPGENIERSITLDTSTNQVTHAVETYDEHEILVYSMESNVENKVPNFYQKVLKTVMNRKCVVYYDYGGDAQKAYKYDVPVDVYFTLFDHEGFTVYTDKDQKTEFTEFELQSENPEASMALYMVKTGN